MTSSAGGNPHRATAHFADATRAAAGATPLLAVEHLTMRFGGLTAIDDLSFFANRGEITALIGPNGAGKTTVFNCITGFYKPTSGRIALAHAPHASPADLARLTLGGQRWRDGKTGGLYLLERMPDYEIAAKARVARTFQNIRLFTGMTVLENLVVAQHNTLMRASGWSILGLIGAPAYRKAERAAIEKARYWLEQTNLLGRADDPAGDLPYGDQRRLEIARAMCTDPVLLCLDEPAAGLNPRESADLNTLLRRIRKDHATSILLIEHDMSVVMEISDRVVVLEHGAKISDGTPEFIRNDPAVVAAYLGVEEDEEAAAEAEIADLSGARGVDGANGMQGNGGGR
ncbi:MAG: ABC transporter ATP-binding protein [Hyphomicrobiaceae bacterium]|nr:ABC transporter ATP-binding protein [Hyphomicrobiaceae bacterium]